MIYLRVCVGGLTPGHFQSPFGLSNLISGGLILCYYQFVYIPFKLLQMTLPFSCISTIFFFSFRKLNKYQIFRINLLILVFIIAPFQMAIVSSDSHLTLVSLTYMRNRNLNNILANYLAWKQYLREPITTNM